MLLVFYVATLMSKWDLMFFSKNLTLEVKKFVPSDAIN